MSEWWNGAPGGRRESRRAAELKALRAELEQRLGQLDFRSESLDQAFAEIAQHAERTIRKLLTT